MKIKLSNCSKSVDFGDLFYIIIPDTEGWRLVESKGKRRIIRGIKVNGKRTTEDLIRYLDKDSYKKYQEILLKIKVKNSHSNRMGKDKYIYKSGDRFFVKIGSRYLGRFSKKSDALKKRDAYIKETSQSILQ